MATKAEKEAKANALAAAAQALIGGRERATGVARGSLTSPTLRQAGDLSRYNIGYTDAPLARARAEAAARARAAGTTTTGTTTTRRRTRRTGTTATTAATTAARARQSTATTASLAAKGMKPGTLYEGRGDEYTGLTIAQAKALAAKKKPAKGRSTRQTGKRAIAATQRRQRAGGARIKAKGTKAPTGERQTLHTGITAR